MSSLKRSLPKILSALASPELPTQQHYQQLIDAELEALKRAKAFGITLENVEAVIQSRLQLFQSLIPTIFKVVTFNLSRDEILEICWQLWLPLAIQISSYQQQLGRPLIQGILGGQGTGKSTLAQILQFILTQMGHHPCCISLDDLYKTYPERLALQAQDPRLIWRGPPGTHDVKLGLEVLARLRQPEQQAVLVPRFDKSAWNGLGDRTQPEMVKNIDIVLFEGWFVGVHPIESSAFDTAPPPIINEGDRIFACDMNVQLKDYLPLWQQLDRLMLLYPVDYSLSKQWRQQAEHQMIASGKSGMNDIILNQFVEYFWKALHPDLFIKPLTKNSDLVDIVIEINCDRSVGAIYLPIDNFQYY